MIEIYPYTGFYDHFEYLKENDMYEKTYPNSYFKSLFSDKEELNDCDITLVMYKENNILKGIALFENEEKSRNFIYNKKKYTNKQIGVVMVYVKPEYRNQGIAKKLFVALENYLIESEIDEYDYDKIINVLAYGAAMTLWKKLYSKIYVTNQRNKEVIKLGIRFDNLKIYKENNNILYY